MIVQVASFIRALEQSWPDISCPSSDSRRFWSYQWAKHGSCANPVLSQKEYFERAVNLKELANIMQALQAEGIEPNGNRYSPTKIRNAIQKAIGYYPSEIICSTDRFGSAPYRLYEIRLCVNPCAFGFMACLNPFYTNCVNNVVFSL